MKENYLDSKLEWWIPQFMKVFFNTEMLEDGTIVQEISPPAPVVIEEEKTIFEIDFITCQILGLERFADGTYIPKVFLPDEYKQKEETPYVFDHEWATKIPFFHN